MDLGILHSETPAQVDPELAAGLRYLQTTRGSCKTCERGEPTRQRLKFVINPSLIRDKERVSELSCLFLRMSASGDILLEVKDKIFFNFLLPLPVVSFLRSRLPANGTAPPRRAPLCSCCFHRLTDSHKEHQRRRNPATARGRYPPKRSEATREPNGQ